MECKNCGSFALNDDPERQLCDRCWRDAKIDRLRSDLAAMTKRAEEAERHGYFCPHCDAVFPLSKDGAFAALAHEQSCHKSPFVLERDRLQADNARLRKALESLVKCHANGGFVEPDEDVLTQARAALKPAGGE